MQAIVNHFLTRESISLKVVFVIVFLSFFFPLTAQTPTAINVVDYGAACNGAADDTAAIQSAFAAALAPGSTIREVSFPAGICRANIVLSNVKGLHIKGQSRLATTIRAIGSDPALRINGLWYSQISGITFDTENALVSKGVVEIDGGSPYIGSQANSFRDCLFAGNGLNSGGLSSYAFTMNRVGGSGAQGSENIFLNCHFSGAVTACYYQNGYNALNNTFIGGNFQSYKKHGIYIIAGSIQIFSVAFQSTYHYEQIVNDGYDIDASSAGVGEQINVIGCRTESLRFYRGGFSQSGVLTGNSQNPGALAWTPNTAFSLNAIVYTGGKLYRVTVAGTSGATSPSWPSSGSVSDGSVVWTQTGVTAVTLPAGEYSRANNIAFGVSAKLNTQANAKEVSADYSVNTSDGSLYVITTSGPKTVNLNTVWPIPALMGQRILIKRHGNDANAVTVNFYTEGCTNKLLTLPGGTYDAAEFIFLGNGAVCGGWRLVNYYEDRRKDIAAAGVVGNRSASTYRFSANFAPGASSLTVTNPLINVSSIVLCSLKNDATLTSVSATPAAGYVVITGNASATSETRVSCVVQ